MKKIFLIISVMLNFLAFGQQTLVISIDTNQSVVSHIKNSDDTLYLKRIQENGVYLYPECVIEPFGTFNTLTLAAHYNRHAVLVYLLNNLKNPSDSLILKNSTMLESSIANGDTSLLRLMFKTYRNFNLAIDNEVILFMSAQFFDYYDASSKYRHPIDSLSPFFETKDIDLSIISILLENDYPVDFVGTEKKTLLIKCSNLRPIVEILLNNRANINFKDKEGNTALFHLIENIIKPPSFDVNGQEILDKELDRDYTEEFELIKFYVKNGAKINSVEDLSSYMMERAKELKNEYFLKFLKEHPLK